MAEHKEALERFIVELTSCAASHSCTVRKQERSSLLCLECGDPDFSGYGAGSRIQGRILQALDFECREKGRELDSSEVVQFTLSFVLYELREALGVAQPDPPAAIYGFEQWDNGCRVGVLVPKGCSLQKEDITDEMLKNVPFVVNASNSGFYWGRSEEDLIRRVFKTHRVIILREEKGWSPTPLTFRDLLPRD